MILFIDKKTHRPVGSIDGRVHNEEQLKIWVGNPKLTYRIIVEYQPFDKGYKVQETKIIDHYGKDKEDFDIPIYKIIKQKVKITDFKPMIRIENKNGFKYKELDKDQIEIFEKLDRGEDSIYNYHISKNKLVKD